MPEAYCINCDKGCAMRYLGWGLCKECAALPRREYPVLKEHVPNKKVRERIIKECVY